MPQSTLASFLKTGGPHFVENAGQFSCHLCSTSCKTPQALSSHLRGIHGVRPASQYSAPGSAIGKFLLEENRDATEDAEWEIQCLHHVADEKDKQEEEANSDVVMVSSDDEPQSKRRRVDKVKLTKEGLPKQTKGAARRPGAHLRASEKCEAVEMYQAARALGFHLAMMPAWRRARS